jgi:uncharacterized protein (TIGR00369 family)
VEDIPLVGITLQFGPEVLGFVFGLGLLYFYHYVFAYCMDIEINANHLRPMAEGYVYGTARPVSLGKTLQVWKVRISSEQEKLVCISRVTMAVLNAASQY